MPPVKEPITKRKSRKAVPLPPGNGAGEYAGEAARKTPEQIDLNEVSTAVSGMRAGTDKFFQVHAFNPDELVARKGLKTYKKMRTDEQVKVGLRAVKQAAISTGWEIEEPKIEGGEEIADEMRRFVEFNLGTDAAGGEMAGTLEQKLMEMMTAIDFGYSATEPTLKLIDYGEFEGFIGIKELKTRDPENIDFVTDVFGNLLDDGVTQFGHRLPKDRFMIYSHDKEFDNWYGTSALRAAYRPWFIKDTLLKFMTMAMERYGEPIAVASTERKLSAPEKADLQAMFKNLQNRTLIIIPKFITLDFKVPQQRAGDAYASVMSKLDSWISRAILLPTKMGLSGESETGSYSQSQTEFDLFLQLLGSIRRIVAALVNDRIIKSNLIDLNYEVTGGNYPKFKFKEITQERKDNIYKLFLGGLARGAVTKVAADENRLRSLIEYPELTEEELAEVEAQKEADRLAAQQQFQPGQEEEESDGVEQFPFTKKKSARRTDFEWRDYEHEFSSTQVDLPEKFRKRLRAWVDENIDEGDLSLDESQGDDFHVTVKYGLHTKQPTELAGLLHHWGPIRATLKGTNVFELPDYDVLVVMVDSADLVKMNQAVSDNLPHTDTQQGYNPHLTLAYLKKGRGEKWRNSAEFSGQTFEFDTVWFSSQDDEWSPVSLTGPFVARTERASEFNCVYCGLHRYHLPGEHDQCDHSPTGQCEDRDTDQIKKDLNVDDATLKFANRTIDKWTKGVDRESFPEIREMFLTNYKNVRLLSLHTMKSDLGISGSFDEFLNKEMTVYRGGAVGGDITNFTIHRKLAEQFAEKRGTSVMISSVKPKDIVGYLMRPNGELLIDRDALGSVRRLSENRAMNEKAYQRRKPNQYEKRVDFEKIDKDLDRLAFDVSADVRKLIRKAEAYAINQVKALIDKGITAGDIRNFRIDTGPEVTARFNQFLIDTYKQGADEAKGELPRGKAKDLIGVRFFQGLEPREALEYFRSKADFDMKGVIDQDMTERVRRSLLQFMKGGKTMSEEIDQIRRIFEPFVGDPEKIGPSGQTGIGFPPGEFAPENVLMAYRLENIIRTNSIDAYNEGRKAIGDAAGDYVIGYNYSAILDTRTCFVKDTPIKLANGRYTPIESIKPGDRIISGAGVERKVEACWRYPAKRWRKLTFEDGRFVICTETHQFWTKTEAGFKWIAALELSALEAQVAAEPPLRIEPDPMPSMWPEIQAIQQQPAQVLFKQMSQRLESCSSSEDRPMQAVRKAPTQKVGDEETILQEYMLLDMEGCLDRAEVPALQNTVPQDEEGSEAAGPGREVLLSGMLSSDQGRAGEKTLPYLREGVFSAEVEHQPLPSMLPKMRRHSQARWDAAEKDTAQVPPMQDDVQLCHQAQPDERAMVQREVSASLERFAYSEKAMRAVRKDNDDADSYQPPILLSCLLYEVGGQNENGNDGGRGPSSHEHSVQTRVSTRQIFRRLSRRWTARPGNGRHVLAQQETGKRQTERCSDIRGGIRFAEIQVRQGDPQKSRFTSSHANHAPEPTETGVIRLLSNKIVEQTGWAYDLEIEGDHSYIANGLVAHNTEICRFLDGFRIRKDDPRLAKLTPPVLYNCRSILTFITTDDLPVEFTDEADLDEGVRMVPAGFK